MNWVNQTQGNVSVIPYDASGNAIEVNSDGQLKVVLDGKVDTNNTTTALLNADAVYTGTATETLDYALIFLTVYSDVASATDGLKVEMSSDGTTWHSDQGDVYTVPAATQKTYSFQTHTRYYRVTYTNGGTNQGTFDLQAVLKKTNSKASSHRISDSIVDDDDAELVKAVLTGKNPAGTFVNFQATAAGNFKMSLEELESGISTNSNSQLKTTLYDESGNSLLDESIRDAFGRWRTSTTGQRLDVEFIYDKQKDFFDEITTNGTVTHNGNGRDLTLSISDANNGTQAKMASHPVPYTPGNSQLIEMTGVLDLANIGGGTAEVFIRSSISGTASDLTTVVQSSWDNNTTGVDWADSHIFMIDFQSLKVGRIRFYMVQDGLPVKLTEINNDNLRNSGFWQMPNLPVYYNLYNDATYTYMEVGYGDDANAVGVRYKITANASATMKAICCTAKSEGGQDLSTLEGLPRSVDRGVSAVTVSTTLIPILSIRPRTTFQTYGNLGLVLPKSYSLSIDNPVSLVIILNGTLTNASFASVHATNSIVEYDTAATAITGGYEIYSEYIATSKNTDAAGQGFLGKTVLWDRQSSETGIFSLCAVRTSTNNSSTLASLNWEEIR